MQRTPFNEMRIVLDDVLARIRRTLGIRLIGLYLYGSLADGDFEEDTSDVDLLAVTASDVDDDDLQRLIHMHRDLALRHPEWDGRIETQYISTAGLTTFRSAPRRMAVISPGDPMHFAEGGIDWLVNWYLVRERGISLFGPAPSSLITPIAKEEFVRAVARSALQWREYVTRTRDSRPYQAYAILTMCRALYTVLNGVPISKRKAALWAQHEMPAWSSLIGDALIWRKDWRNPQVDAAVTFPEASRFVNHVADEIARLPDPGTVA